MKKFTKYSRGFTLIELLVVIAIIGILSAIVLASLSTARSKGKDAAVQEQLSGARAQAEIFAASSSNSYYTSATVNVCSQPTSGGGIQSILNGAQASAGASAWSPTGTAPANTSGTVTGSCYAASGGTVWLAMMPLSTAGTFWCVDNSGNSKLEPASWTPAALSSLTICP
jgi:prepilin-type N-terminal cleavage/methylation domain-containing protein